MLLLLLALTVADAAKCHGGREHVYFTDSERRMEKHGVAPGFPGMALILVRRPNLDGVLRDNFVLTIQGGGRTRRESLDPMSKPQLHGALWWRKGWNTWGVGLLSLDVTVKVTDLSGPASCTVHIDDRGRVSKVRE